jgi:hypothetical protein
VAITPDSETLYPSDRETFTASVTGAPDQSVIWAVAEGDAGGGVAEDGTYTAPSTEGTYHLVATSRANPTTTATTTIAVSSRAGRRVTVTVAPTTATVAAGGSQAFTCTVTGATDKVCKWSVREGAAGGTVTSAGVYTAPQTAGIYHVVARSRADTTKRAAATVTVTASQPPPPVAVTITPTTATLSAGGSQTFTCGVTGSADTACNWSVQEGAGGTVSSAGVYTAPQAAGTYHVVAKSHPDTTKTATATVTVTAPPPPVAVTISPTAATLSAGGSQTFTCAVTGSADTACTWSVQEGTSGGTVTSAGVYTAPQAAGTYHVVARSHADTTRTATATVTVTAPPPPVAISMTPATAEVDACGTFTFVATVTGTSNTAVTWSVSEGSAGGSVSTGGVYTAPASGGTYHVVATSQADSSKSQTAAVTVTEKIVSVEVNPGSTTVTAGGTVQFTATVTTTCGSFTQTAEAAAN